MPQNEYVDVNSFDKDLIKVLNKKNASVICSKLSRDVAKLAEEANVEDILAAYTTKLVVVFDKNSHSRMFLYIDIYAAIREFTEDEKNQAEKFNRSPDAESEIKRLVADTSAVLTIAGQGGFITDVMVKKDGNSNFLDDINLPGMTKPCGKILVCMTLISSTHQGPSLVKRDMTKAHKVDVLRYVRNTIGNIPQAPIEQNETVSFNF